MTELLELDEFRGTKASISITSKTEKEMEWKGDLIEYLNDETDVDSRRFFYAMIPAIRFINEPGEIAYTTPGQAICLNAPCKEVENIYDRWYFIYLHECLHQMWDTFGAEDEIRDELGDCDGYLMNIASDCVINEFLHIQKDFRLPFPTKGLITAKKLKDEFNIDYNPRTDTQTILYKKLLPIAEKLKNSNIEKGNPKNRPTIDKKTDDYVKGWNQAIEDWKAGKIKI